MLRRGRNSRARHLARSDTRQETDVMAADCSTDSDEQESQTLTQVRKDMSGLKISGKAKLQVKKTEVWIQTTDGLLQPAEEAVTDRGLL